MRIGLVQLHANDHHWGIGGLRLILDTAPDVDLLLFPECMPFDTTCEASQALEELSLASSLDSTPPFIAGGYVRDDGGRRNTIYLMEGGKALGEYSKRVRWKERFTPGNSSKLFQWSRGKCFPLICADASVAQSPQGTRMMHDALELGVNKRVPIIVSAYGSLFFRPYWQTPLQAWAFGTGAPVVVCNIAGKGKAWEHEGDHGHFGGGGSGVFWPDGSAPLQFRERGIHIISLTDRQHQTIALPR